MVNKYKIRVNCTSYMDMWVTADSLEEAKTIAENQFAGRCDGVGEFCELLETIVADSPPKEKL